MMDTTSISQGSINRFGLSQVHTPVGQALVDVVFVHGLHGHPYDTWTSEQSKIFWPGQLLPCAVEEEKARILVYGYDADVTSFTDGASRDKIHNHAEHLVADLVANRRGQKAVERPLVFVAHSLGGLVVKRALIHSSEVRGNKTEHLRSIFVSTYGILFFGTPHRGSDIAEWGSRLEWICGAILTSGVIDTQPQLVSALKTNSETLQNIDRQFIQLASRFHIYFFHEGKPTNLKGTLQYIVDEESAAPSIQDVERACIQQDHSHMCKFESDSAAGFHIVKDAIQRYASQALAIVVSRWNTEKAEQQRKRQAQADELLRVSQIHIDDTASSRSTLPGSSKASKPLFLVPFGRDKWFINRIDIFAKINKCIDQHQRVALSGIGGIGKSQIAIEYCHRFRDDHPHAQVFWVHASTKQRFEQAYRNIARRLQLPGWNDPNIDTLRLVSDWFDEAEDESWLMVLDNADDLDMFSAEPISTAHDNKTTPLNDYLPQSSRGSMLITTRDDRLAMMLAGMHASIAVNPMSPQEAQDLLKNWQTGTSDNSNIDHTRYLLEALRYIPLGITQAAAFIRELAFSSVLRKAPQPGTSDNSNIDHTRYLLEVLGYIPLAITQAAAFIHVNHITLAEYLETFRTSDSDVQDLLDKDVGDPRRDRQSHNSVIKTWKLSFDLISKQKPRAAEILSLMAVLDRQGIPESLLRHKADRNVEVMTALGTLKSFSLVRAGIDNTGYEIHRLVQLATQNWLEMQGKIQVWQEKALLVIADMFPIGEHENWTTCESLLPHAQKVVQYRDATEKYPLEFSGLLSNMARFDSERGRYEEACAGFSAATGLRKANLGLKHGLTLQSMHNLALTYNRLGRLEKAEKLQEQVLELRKEVLGSEHPITLTSINNLALTYQERGRWKEAEELQIQVIELQQRVLGAEHPHTLTSTNNLACTYREQGRWEKAEELHAQVLEAEERLLGAEHKNTLTSKHNLVCTIREQGRWEEAEKLQVQLLEVSKRALGAEHPARLTSMNNLASLYLDRGRLEEAEKLYKQVLEVREPKLGPQHPDTLISIHDLAFTYQKQGRWKEAEKLQLQVIELRKGVLGAEHPQTLLTMHNLAHCWNSQGRHSEAIALLENVVDLRTKKLGPSHPDTMRSASRLVEWRDA